MSILSLLFKKANAEIGGIKIDASVSETHLTEMDLTENPVENGAKITDHVQIKPNELTIEGVISDSPLGDNFVQSIVNLEQKISTFFGTEKRSIDAYNQMLKLQRSRDPFTVTTGLKVYSNMILTSLSINRTSETSNAIHFTANMKEIRIIGTSGNLLSNLADEIADIASDTLDLGGKVTSAIPFISPLSSVTSALTEATRISTGVVSLANTFSRIGSIF